MNTSFLAKRKTAGGTALLVLAALFIGLIILSNYGLRGLRADFTQNNAYTLAPGTRNILKNIKEPINLYFYFSHAAGEQAPMLKIYATRVREMLQELQARAGDKLRLHIIDPESFSEEEDRATELGLTAVPLGQSGEKMYFGLAGTNSTDGKAAIEIFQPDKEAFLEYDIVKLIQQLSNPKKPVVALLSTLPMMPDYRQIQMMAQQTGQMPERMPDPWAVLAQLNQLFEVRTLEPGFDKIDDTVNVLMLVHPKNLSNPTLFAIDQFVLKGGHAIIFVDPRAEADPAQQDPQMSARGPNGQMDPYAAMTAPRNSDLPTLFKAWGIEYNSSQVVGDAERALSVSMRQGEAPVRHLGILGLDADSLNRKDVITGALSAINVANAGAFSLTKDSPLTLEPLLQTSTQSGFISSDKFMMMGDAAALRDGFKPGGKRLTIAGRLTGKLKTAFPGGAPGAAGTHGATTPSSTAASDDASPAAGKNTPAAAAPPALKESVKPANIVLVADADMLADMLWVRTQSFFGQRVAQAFASNGDFVFNSIDNLSGSSDLISIRGRASFVRPFDRVEDIKRGAEEKFRTKEKELEEQLRTTEQKLTELSDKSKNPNSALILTPEQEHEIERFRDEKVRIRKELREVRHGLDRDIKSLGRTIRIINIGLIPLLLSILALLAVGWRRRRAEEKK